MVDAKRGNAPTVQVSFSTTTVDRRITSRRSRENVVGIRRRVPGRSVLLRESQCRCSLDECFYVNVVFWKRWPWRTDYI
ncbi:hypothetical protein GW17_00015105 [Ensete ventricosum]|nr:hypothetical protein GW17_00015105 [Ensete ventricosum]